MPSQMSDKFSISKAAQLAAKLLFIALVSALTTTMALPFSDISFAHPPAQGPQGDVVFEASTYSAADGSATIRSQETSLNAAYFGNHGATDGLQVSSLGLELAPGRSRGAYTSDPIASPMAVTTDLVPSWRATLPPGSSLKVETRLSADGVDWSDWTENPEAFYPVRDDEHGGTLIWLGSRGPVLVQVRLTLSGDPAQSPALQYLTLVFNDASDGPNDAQIASQLPAEIETHVCPARMPYIVSRVEWGAPEGPYSPRWNPVPTEVTHVVVHHTATPSSFAEWNYRSPYYQINDWATVVRAIWNYHANVNRWGDVGYNFLIDPNGVIYEGRAGSAGGDYDIIGAHDGKNNHSMGLGFIGCYGNCNSLGLVNAEPPQPMVNKGVELIAWKFGQKGIDPLTQDYYHGLLVPTLAGGRDVSATASPGDNLYYNWLPWMRDAVADRVSCQPPPPPQGSCQVTDIWFDRASYETYDTINLRATVLDEYGYPLDDADVRAVINVDGYAENTIFLDPRYEGEYEGFYNQTATPGLYTFEVIADHTLAGTCSAAASVEVFYDDPGPEQCTIDAFTLPDRPLDPGESVELIADVFVDGQPVANATVSGNVTRPNGAFTEFPFAHQGGNRYNAAFNDTGQLGRYDYFVIADGPDFDSCQVNGSFRVEDGGPPPGGATVGFDPDPLVFPACDVSGTTDLYFDQVDQVKGFDVTLRFDPNVVQVVDADPNRDGVQIVLGPDFSNKPNLVVVNTVDQNNGLIQMAATLIGDGIVTGGGVMAEIAWTPVGPGSSDIVIENLQLARGDGSAPNATRLNGRIEVPQNCGGGFSGQIQLQGRNNHSGVTVSGGPGLQAQTDAEGFFSLAGGADHAVGGELSISYPGYLSARAEVQTLQSQASVAGSVWAGSLGSITLLAGDTNADNTVDIFDLTYIANRFRSGDELADLNADGTVTIADLAMAAKNFRQSGPLTNWR